MTPVDIIAQRVAPLWTPKEKLTGNATRDANAAMSQRYRKADGKQTQFNTGALVVREDRVTAFTECQPLRLDGSLQLRSPIKSRTSVIDDIRENGPPLLAVLFRKGAIDVASWVCSTPDEIVLNGPAGAEVTVLMDDVKLLRSLNGSLRSWREAANLYAAARADLSLAPKLYELVDKLAAAVGEDSDAVLQRLHQLHRVDRVAYELADTSGKS